MSSFHVKRWNEFLEEGEKLYYHLCHHFDDLFTPDKTEIIYFDMSYATVDMMEYDEALFETRGKEIHDAILPWILEEHRSGRLLNKEWWTPVRDPWDFFDMYYGYRKLFLFETYYLQLGIIHGSYDGPNNTLEHRICLQTALYCMKDGDVTVTDDMLMPDKHWNRK